MYLFWVELGCTLDSAVSDVLIGGVVACIPDAQVCKCDVYDVLMCMMC